MSNTHQTETRIKVVGVGGAGGNAVMRMVADGVRGVEFLALNTDVQALGQMKGVRTFAFGPKVTGGMGSGGDPETGRKAFKESQAQVAQMLKGSDLVFIAVGMGGGTGTGAASSVAAIAKKQGALTVGVVTYPFSFEGPRRQAVASEGLHSLYENVDTLITVENDRLLPSLKGKVSLEKAFRLADDTLRQGVVGISDMITVPGLVNVDFADVSAVMRKGGHSFMAVGEGKGRWAAIEAAHMALANPLFDAPLEGAAGILFNIKGGRDLTLSQVHEVAEIIRKAAGSSEANVIFGVVQERKMKKRVCLTVVATGLKPVVHLIPFSADEQEAGSSSDRGLLIPVGPASTNGHVGVEASGAGRMF